MKTFKNTIVIKVSIIALIALISSCNKYNELYIQSLKGNVKSVDLEIYSAGIDEGKIEKYALENKYFTTYDKKGFTTSHKDYYINNENDIRVSYSANANNDRSIVEKSITLNNKDTIKYIFRSKNNKPLSLKTYYNDSYLGEIIYHTENNKLFLGIGKNSKGEVESRVILEYQNCKLVSEIYFNDAVDQILCTYYDRKSNKKTKDIRKDNSGEKILEFIYNDSGFLEKSINCRYDEIGGSISDESSKNYLYKYEILDNRKNWIKCIVYEEGNIEPVYIKERKITYY